MPLYQLTCPHCGRSDEVMRSLKHWGEPWPDCCGEPMRQVLSAPYVAPDIQPYRAMGVDVATGECPVIGSRSTHRAYLKRNGYEEVGNDMPQRRPPVFDLDVRKELTEAVNNHPAFR